MTLKQLRYLIAIVEAGSFSNAARQAFIAQPALSRQIGLLESELEMQLLARQHDGIELTDAGRQLYEVARSVVQQLDSVKDELKSSRGNPKGHVAISIPATASAIAREIGLGGKAPKVVVLAPDEDAGAVLGTRFSKLPPVVPVMVVLTVLPLT